MSAMTTLVEFMLTRIGEDEQVARRAAEAGETITGKEFLDSTLPTHEAERRFIARRVHVRQTDENLVGVHPDRILNDCKMRRLMIDLHNRGHECTDLDDTGAADRRFEEGENCSVLRLIALCYSAHREYDRSWLP